MSIQTIPYQAPEGPERSGSARVPTTVLGAIAGVGLLLLLPGQARADGNSYGHAEITLGFPHGQVTVGKTWDDNPRRVVVEEVTHKYPAEDDFDDEDDQYDGDADEPDQVIIEKRHHHRHVKKVTVIERYEEPVLCDREVQVVRKVYVDPPSCERHDVVVYGRAPERVIYAPSRTVIVAPGRGYGYRGDDRGYHGDRGGFHGSDHVIQNGNRGPRNLFPEDQGRPVRTRGVQQHLVSR
ncbi:MAG: hypothetical protein JWO30_587 [Fibrobacteres bacterium]|nr:hypothetical protein [Fibrobacterota bacterium]